MKIDNNFYMKLAIDEAWKYLTDEDVENKLLP